MWSIFYLLLQTQVLGGLFLYEKKRNNILQNYNESKQILHYSHPYLDVTIHTIQNIRTTFSISMLHGKEIIKQLYFNAKHFWKFPNLKIANSKRQLNAFSET